MTQWIEVTIFDADQTVIDKPTQDPVANILIFECLECRYFCDRPRLPEKDQNGNVRGFRKPSR